MNHTVGAILCAGIAIQCTLVAYRRRLLSIKSLEHLQSEKIELELKADALRQRWQELPSRLQVDRHGMVKVSHLEENLATHVYTPSEPYEATGLTMVSRHLD